MHELQQIVWSTDALSCRPAPLPSAKRLRPRPGSSGCAAFPISVCYTEIDVFEEVLLLFLVVTEYSRSQSKIRIVCFLQCFFDGFEIIHSNEGNEQFFFQQLVIGGEACYDNRFDVVAFRKLLLVKRAFG